MSEKDKEYCDTFPSLAECEEAVKNMKSNKSPALDGLTSEFYKTFWGDLKYLFYNSLKKIYENKEMSFSQRLAVMTLIHKKGDTKLLKNYRPISLTNTDYKIIAFVFARRLQKIIDKLISKNQSAYIKGRFIGENATLILDIFDYCKENNYDGILLFLDFEKAFDSVEWNFLVKSLIKFSFGMEFITWIKILYCNPIFRVKNNGWLSKTCKMSRGIRQGCPISALLYIFVAEILALKIHDNANIQGFELESLHEEIKTVQHADDLTVLLKNAQSLSHTLSTIREFCLHAGSKVNIEKTECILLGSLKDTFDNVYNINVNTTCVKCLGIFVGHDRDECFRRNWTNTMKDMEKLFEFWKKRKLTIFGKCEVINTLAISKLIYTASILPLPPPNFIKEINKLIYNYLWGSRDRIKRNTLIGPVKSGGIGIVDIETKFKALKASWIPRLYNGNSNTCKFLGNIQTV